MTYFTKTQSLKKTFASYGHKYKELMDFDDVF